MPHRNSRQHGTYYQENGNYYYHPQTYSIRPNQHLNTRPQQIASGSFSRVEDLGSRLESLTNDFCLELHSNYSRNRGFDDVYREAYQMLEIAKYIHKEDHDGHHNEIAREASKLDELFHHVQGEVSQWHSTRDLHHNTSMGIQTHLELIEATIHHLMNDVGSSREKFQGRMMGMTMLTISREPTTPLPRGEVNNQAMLIHKVPACFGNLIPKPAGISL